MRIRGTVRRAIVLSAAAALGAGSIAGCTSDLPTTSDPPVSGTRATATPSPSASPTVNVRVKPERPDAWDDVSVDGAIAVATYFLKLYAYTYATVDLEPWNQLKHPECVYCEDVSQDVHDMGMAGQHTEGGAIDLSDVRGREVSPGELYAIDLTLHQAPFQIVTASGQVAADWSEPQDASVSILVLHDDGRWSVREVEMSDVGAK